MKPKKNPGEGNTGIKKRVKTVFKTMIEYYPFFCFFARGKRKEIIGRFAHFFKGKTERELIEIFLNETERERHYLAAGLSQPERDETEKFIQQNINLVSLCSAEEGQ